MEAKDQAACVGCVTRTIELTRKNTRTKNVRAPLDSELRVLRGENSLPCTLCAI